MKYDCHLNVEVCNSVAAVKYIYKYVYKGHDRVMVEFRDIANTGTNEQHDEISNYLDARYVSASESCWRIFHFKLHGESPNIVRLQVHLPDQEMVVFDAGQNLDEVIEKRPKTNLTGWMEYNTTHDHASHILYHDFPKKFVWNQKERKWTCRKSMFSVIGRMYFVRPREGERYFLRLLLCHVPGVISYDDLRTVEGTVHSTFHVACLAHGFLEDDTEWEATLREASTVQSGKQLRQLFVDILLFCSPSNPHQLWNIFKDNMSEEFDYRDTTLSTAALHRNNDSNYCYFQTLQALGRWFAIFKIHLLTLTLTPFI